MEKKQILWWFGADNINKICKKMVVKMSLFSKKAKLPNECNVDLMDINTKFLYHYRIKFIKLLGERNLYRVETNVEKAQNEDKIDLARVKKVTIPQRRDNEIPIRNSFLLKTNLPVYKLMIMPGFADEMWLLLDEQRIRERLLRSNPEVQKHYLYYRIGQKDRVLAQTMLYVGSINDGENGVYRAYTKEDEEFNTYYAMKETERIDSEIHRIRREKEWKQICSQTWKKLVEESRAYQESKKPYKPKHAKMQFEEDFEER